MQNNYKTQATQCSNRTCNLFIALIVLLLSSFSANAQFTNVPVTGFNNDIVANGTGDGTNGTTLNTVSTGNMNGMVTQPAIGVDGVGYTLIDATYKWYSASTLPACFMPTGGAVPSALTSGLTYQLQSYSGFNARTIVSNTYSGSVWPTTGSVSLVTPASYGNLYVLYESVMNTAGPTVTATVTFTDASTQVFPGNALVNWFTATGVAYTPSISRAQNVAPGTANACATGPYLFQMTLPISPANYSKQVQSISFAWSAPTGGAANTVDYLHVMAVGGLPPCSVPVDQPTALNLSSPSGTVINGTFTAAPSAPSGYLTVAYPGGSTPVAPTSGNNYIVGNSIGTGKVVGVGAATSFSATGLYPGITYDLYVYSFNSGACATAYNTISPLAGSLTTSGVGASLLINPYTDGGFETGGTLASNGWTVVNSATNAWTVGTVPTGFTNQSAYISNNGGAAWAYTNNSVTASHIYKDITFPAGQTDITLSFNWKALGEASSWDAIIVYTCPTTVTPATTSPTGTGNAATWTGGSPTAIGSQLWNQGVNLQTFTACLPASFAGTTQRIVITWKNDGTAGVSPPAAIDNVALVSSTPTAPATQATSLVLTPISTSQINGSFTAAVPTPAGYLVVRYPNLAATTNPVTGTTYTVGQALGLGTVVSVGTSTTFTNTGLVAGTTYDYYVYDYATATCAGNVYNLVAPLTLSLSTLPCGSMSGVIPVGPTAPAAPAGFPTLSGAGGALAYINTNGLGGNTILELQPDYTTAYAAANETYPITFPSNPCINNTKTLTVRPAAGVPSVITLTSANSTLATVLLDGGSFITLDGRNGGTGTNKFLRIINTSSTALSAGNAVMMRNEASNNTLTFLDLQASNLNPASNTGTITGGAVPGVVAILSTAGANGNDNNTISNCDIHAATAVGNILNTGIYAFNNTAVGNASNNDNNTITNCNIYDCFNAATATAGINLLIGNNNYTITNNSYYKSAALAYAYTAAVAHRGFWVTPGASAVASSGFTITGNFIGGTAPSCGGAAFSTTSTSSNSFNGMDISVGTASFTSVQNNTITNINHTTPSTASTAFVGINIAGGNLNVGTITGNLIGSTTLNGAITFTATGNLGGVIGIRTGGGTSVNISNNTVSGINLIGSATITPVFSGINAGGGTTVNITNNTVGSTSLTNSINASSVYTGTTSIQTIRGIFVNAGTTSTVTGNTIANINTSLTSLSGAHTLAGIAVSTGTSTVSGNTIRNLTSASQSTSGGSTPSVIGISYTTTTAPATISGNTIHTLKNTNTTTTSGPVVAGIFYGGPSGTANIIEKNNIHSLVLSSNTVNASAAITGMDIASGQVTIRNNMIRLGFDENGNSIVVPTLVRGISKNVNIANIYFNSVFIGGTGVLSTVAANTFAFQRTAAATTDDIRNNIFVNNRSNATTGGKHYQISLSSTATITLNYNDYFGTGTGTVFGFNGTSDVASYSAGWVAGDLNSQVGNPQFINPTGTAVTGDLHISPSLATVIEQQGTNIATVTDDFDSQTRSSFTPEDIGADAGNFNPVNACVGPPASATAFLTVPAQVCGFVSKTVSLSGFTPQPGLTYQWQESLTGLPGSFVNVTGGTGANTINYVTAPLNASIYYQCIIGCSFGGGTLTSTSVQALINAAPVMTVTPLTGTSVCSGSNVDLIATGANTYSWAVNPGVAGYPVVSLLSTPNNIAKVTSRPTSTLASSTATPPATVATPTWTYTVTGTALNGCTATSSVVLNVITTPVVPVQLTYTNSPDPVCATGVPVTFTVNNTGSIGAGSWVYNWYDQTGTTLLQSTTNTNSTDTYTPTTPVTNGNYIYQVRVSNTVCPASYAVASPSYFVGYTSLNVIANANCGNNGSVIVYPEGQNNFTTWYSNNFATGLLGPAFDASFGNTNFTGGRCNITPQTNSQNGALIIRNSAFINSNNLQVDFKMSTAPRGFAFNILGADGLCWSYGGDVTVGTITTGGQGEGGSGTGLKLAFDATANGPNNFPGAYLMYNSTTVGQGPGDPGVLAYKLGSWWQGLVDAPVSIIISQNGFVTVSVNNEVIFDHVPLPAAYLTTNKSTWIHSFTARTGGSNELHAIDDLNIRYNSYEYSNNSTTGLDGTWQSSNTFSGLAAGTYPMWVRNPSNTACVSNVGNAVIGTSPSPSSAITVAAPGFNTVICAGSSTDLTTDVSIPGAIFLWETSANIGGPYTPASGINNAATYSTGVLLANAYFRCTFTCPSSSPITSTPALVTVNSGTIASTNSPVNSNCIGDAVTLTAVPGANTTCVWYAAQTGGSPLFAGNSYTVTPGALPATYYVEPVTTLFVNHFDFGGEKSVGGNLNGGSIGGTGIASKFNTTASIRIDSIKVLPNASGTLTVALQNAGSATNISTFNLAISAAQVGTFVNVPVNFAIAGSGNYQLTTTGVSCSYNNAYPAANYSLSYMNLGGVFSIVGGSTTATGGTSTSVYGTAYNWSITTSCPTGGARVPVSVQVNPSTAVIITPASSTICSGAILTLTASSLATYDSINWTPVTNLFKDNLATDPYTAGYNAATVYYKSNSGLVTTITARGTNTTTLCSNIKTTTINVQPAAVTISSSPVAICGTSGSATLSLSPTSPYAPGSIQWQISSDGMTYVDIPSANAVTYPTGVINVTTYYRAVIKDGSNNICLSADYTLGVYQPQVLTTAPATRCGTGTLTLGATGSAGTSFNWYAVPTGGSPISATPFADIPVYGFNNDVVANGVGVANTVSSGSLAGMVSYPALGMDGQGFTFIDNTYQWYSGSSLPSCFLPPSGQIPSALTSGLTYQLQPYTTNNAMSIASNNYAGSILPTTGSVNLTAPASYANLKVLYETVQNTAGSTITATVTFTDASTQVFAGNTFVNWFTATGVAYTPSISRTGSAAPGTPGACATGPYLFEMNLPLSPGNYAKQVQDISFNFSSAIGSSATTVNYLHVLAVGGAIAPVTAGTFTTPVISATTTYYVEAANSICVSAPRVAVVATVTPAPVVTVSAGTIICEGDNTTLAASSVNDPNYQYTWNPGGFVGNSYTVSPSVTTTYTVTALDTTTGGSTFNCQDIQTVTVTVNQRPTINSLTSALPTICNGDSTQITLTATPFIAPSGNYTVTSATYSAPACPSNAGPTGDDVISATLPIGFSFNYYGTTYTQFAISTNGNIQLGNGSGTAGNPAYSTIFTATTLPTASAPNNMIALCWADLTASAGNITYGTTGVSPNQKLIVCYNNIPWLNASGNLTGQIILSEGSSAVELILTSVTATTGNRVCGIENSTGTLGTMAPSRTLGTWTASNEKYVFNAPVSSSLTYAWSPATGLSSTNVQNPKAAPSANTTYTVTVAETGTGCSRTATLDINVTALPKPKLTPGDTALCSNDFAIDMIVVDTGAYAGGYPPGTTFDFLGLGAILYQTGTSNIFTNQQQSDAFYVVVTLPSYLGGCTGISDTSVIDFSGAQAPQYVFSTDSVKCYGGATGKAKIEIVFGGTPDFRYQWYDSGQNNLLRDTTAASLSDSLQNVPAGMYVFVISDHQGATVSPFCSVIDSVFVGEPLAPLSVSENIANHVNVLCNGALTGAVDIDLAGGTVPYSYNWSNGTSSEDLTMTGVGTYTCTITDKRGCSVTISSTITEPTVLSTNCSVTPVSCNGGSDGTAGVTAIGGTPGYSYLWSTGGTNATISGLPAGTYTVTVTDANLCSTTCSSIVEQPDVLLAICSSTNVTCRGAANGFGSVQVLGGNIPYTYLWSNGNTANSISGLIPGDYTVTVTDSKGCSAICGFTITQPNTLKTSLSSTNPTSLSPSSGTITSTTTGGTSPYAYLWNDGVTTANRTGIPGGTYTVSVTDALGCTTTKSVTLTYECSLSATNQLVQQASCFMNNGIMTVIPSGGTGYSYLWQTSPVQTTATGTGLAYGVNSYCLVTDIASGCSIMDTVIVPTRKGIKASMGVTNINCNGGSNGSINLTVTGTTGLVTYIWSNGATTEDLNGLSAGVYTVTITNGGCILTSFTTLTQPAVLSATASSTASSCGSSNGTATVTAVGGKGTYSYSWNTIPAKTTKTATGLAAGTYTVTVTDANGCSTTASVSVTSAAGLTVTGVAVNVSCNGGGNGSIALTVSGGTSPYTYNWSNGSTVKNQNAVPAGTYTVTVTSVNGCIGSYSATITQPTAITATTSTTPASCFGGTNGTATIVVSGGTPSYSYSWNSIPVKTTATATGLKKGIYTCTVTDSKGCIKFYNATVNEPAAIVISITKTNVSVFGGNNGTATANVGGGVSPYSYAWSTAPVQTTQTATGLVVGTYTVVVTDVNGCTNSGSVTITQPTARMALGEIETVNSIVYPNPSNGMVTVSFDQNIAAKVSVAVYTLTGNQVFTKDLEVKENATLFDLDLTGLAKGIYSIQYRTNDKQWIEKLVIQ